MQPVSLAALGVFPVATYALLVWHETTMYTVGSHHNNSFNIK